MMNLPELPISQRVLAQGLGLARSGGGPGQTIVEWRSNTNDARDIAVQLNMRLQGQPMCGIAGQVGPTGLGTSRVFNAWWTLTYGAGNNINRVDIDAQPGVYQFPPCDFLRAQINYPAFYALGDSFDFAASVVQGQYPFARPPTWSWMAGDLTAAWAANQQVLIPSYVRSLDLHAFTRAASAAWVQLKSTLADADAVARELYWSSDGSGSPMPAAMVTMPQYTFLPLAGVPITQQNRGNAYNVLASDNTVVSCIGFVSF